MLVLQRGVNEMLLFPALGISIGVMELKPRTAKLGISAPSEFRVVRAELPIRPADFAVSPSIIRKLGIYGPQLWNQASEQASPSETATGDIPSHRDDRPQRMSTVEMRLETARLALEEARRALAQDDVGSAAESIEVALAQLPQRDESERRVYPSVPASIAALRESTTTYDVNRDVPVEPEPGTAQVDDPAPFWATTSWDESSWRCGETCALTG